uniref:Zgc:195245 n=1 Tax=Sander lucioperca TaxID=283035 RepID=A0A8D0AKD5_SANLU
KYLPDILFNSDCSSDEVLQPRKLNGSSVETPSYQNLHRELLLSHKRGLLLEEKPELQRVLEQRRLELHKEEEMARQQPSDLETELRKRQQKLQELSLSHQHQQTPSCSKEGSPLHQSWRETPGTLTINN